MTLSDVRNVFHGCIMQIAPSDCLIIYSFIFLNFLDARIKHSFKKTQNVLLLDS